jgi:transposase InsO family protein
MMMAFIDIHHGDLGIEPICREPSSWLEHAARLADPGRRPARARRDDEFKEHIKRVHKESFGLYGSRKVWRQMRREGIKVAKCTVERLSYTQRLAEANLAPSVGSVGDSYDNELAETINGLCKAEVMWRQRSWPSVSAVEMATLRWIDWFNNHRLFGPIGHVPPAEAEAKYYAAIKLLDMVA